MKYALLRESLGSQLGFFRNFFIVFMGVFVFVLTKCYSLRPLLASTQCPSHSESISFHLENSSLGCHWRQFLGSITSASPSDVLHPPAGSVSD